MLNISEWDFDKVEDGTHKIAGEVQLRSYGSFLEEYSSQLQGIEEALEDHISDSWDITIDPIALQFSAYEKINLLELVETDNKILSKVLSVFTVLCSEVELLTKEARVSFYDSILYYGEGAESESLPEGEWQVQVARFLPKLQTLWAWVKRCSQVCQELVAQLDALYSTQYNGKPLVCASEVHFQEVLEHLGDLLVALITVDEMLRNQGTLHDHWTLFCRMLKSVHHDPVAVGIQAEKMRALEKLVGDYESCLLSGKIFQGVMQKLTCMTARCPAVADELTGFVRSAVLELETRPAELQDADHWSRWVKLSALMVMNFSLFGSVDKKVFKQLWDVNKKIPAVTLYANIIWFPEQFLLYHMPQLNKVIDKKAQQQVSAARQAFLTLKAQSLPKEVQLHSLQACCWMVQVETALHKESTNLKLEDINNICSLLLQGVQLACGMSRLLRTLTNLHVALAKPMSRSSVAALCRLVEVLQGVRSMYHRHSVSISRSVVHVSQHLLYQALTTVTAAKKSLLQNKKYSEQHLDVLSALLVVERSMYGCTTKERRLVTRLALSMANQGRTFREEDYIMLLRTLRKLDAVCDMQSRLSAACDCSFLYWHRVVLPIYFESLYSSKTDLHRLGYMLYALRDCVRSINNSGDNSESLKEMLETEVWDSLRKYILDPLCHDIETSLRLSVHVHLQVNERNPFSSNIPDYGPLLRVRPMRFFDKYIDIKGYVEHHLDQTFYNLTTVALHDWKTYGEMRCLAKLKNNLVTVEDHLPSQTLEQGLDVLEIMRNIHIFVSKYLYNLNNQIFVEQWSNNKHLNTINIRHIANSIRTHGTGIMNTTVNFTYQFLRKKFFIFSQFMYDEHIKSRLLKDLRFFRENKTQLEQKYSYERADKFNRGIRKLGITPQGHSYLDQFRMLISHIGNAMGYVRMIRSGGLHCCSNAIGFVPDLEDVVNFESLCVNEGLSESCINAAKQLDHVIENLGRNFAEGTEYFKLLVNVFSGEFRKPGNSHLRNFHIIIPPLTINFVEYIIASKERLTKKNKGNAAFTDDGFAMGLAYILTLLDLQVEWDALHWFESVQVKYSKEKASLSEQKNSARGQEDEKLQQTMTLTARRLDVYQQEFELLQYSLSSARIFFQKDDKPAEVSQDKTA